MTDITRYANVSLKRDTYNKLKDLSAINETPVSKSAMITYLVDKEWTKDYCHKSRAYFLGSFPGLQVKVNQMTIDKQKVLVSDRGLKHQVFVESPPVVAGKIRSYINSFKANKRSSKRNISFC